MANQTIRVTREEAKSAIAVLGVCDYEFRLGKAQREFLRLLRGVEPWGRSVVVKKTEGRAFLAALDWYGAKRGLGGSLVSLRLKVVVAWPHLGEYGVPEADHLGKVCYEEVNGRVFPSSGSWGQLSEGNRVPWRLAGLAVVGESLKG